MIAKIVLLFVIVAIASAQSKYELAADYVTVDEQNGANILYYMYKVADSEFNSKKPVVVWLQGGPGASSILGDLCEIGPIDLCGEAFREVQRNYTWMKEANAAIFIDQPVGTGFSYVKNAQGYATSEDDIARHAVIVFKQIYSRFSILHNVPLYIFSESYGGKMNANIALALYNQRSSIPGLNLAGIALGDSWISPELACKSYGEYFYQLSHADSYQKAQINSYADKISNAIATENWSTATDLWGQQQEAVIDVTDSISFYNFLRHSEYTYDNMTKYVNTVFRQKLNAVLPAGKSIPSNVQWALESGQVFQYLVNDFMKPAVQQVQALLNSGVKVIVYNGQLDVIVPTSSNIAWIEEMTDWKGLSGWSTASPYTVSPQPPVPQDISGILGKTNIAFRKKYQNLDFWRVLFAGHMVPQDNPLVAYEMFKRITDESYDEERTISDLRNKKGKLAQRTMRKLWKPVA